VAIDQNVTPSSPSAAAPVSAVDNEIPAYRAISPVAVISVIFGVLAVLSFANWFFLSCAVIAVALGIYADRKIQRFSDTLTGRRLAQAGTALGLIFGLTAVSIGLVQNVIQKREAAKFARELERVLKDGSYEDALTYKMAPARRAGKTREQLIEEARKAKVAQKKEREDMADEMENGQLRRLKARLAIPSQSFRFDQIEATLVDGLTAQAAARFKVEGPGNAEFPDTEQYALLVFKANTNAPRYEWWLDQVVFPYKPASFVPAEKPVDDGHGHGGH
jgi:hypothetical protein